MIEIFPFDDEPCKINYKFNVIYFFKSTNHQEKNCTKILKECT